MTKRCAKCHADKAACDFSRSSGNKDGLQSYCKLCAKAANKGHRRTITAEKRRSLKMKYKERNRAQYIAWKRVEQAVLMGKLKKLPCEVCSTENTEAHHDDYTKPLEVSWLCDTHHRLLHNGKDMRG